MKCKVSPIWLIAGPTASGKSALALHLAQASGGEILNADSMQVYRDLPILSAQPTPEDRRAAPHHLYGVADAAEGWSVGRWLAEALPILEDIGARGRPAIVVGGTGLYFNALTRGLANLPPTPKVARDVAAMRLEQLGEPAFRAELAKVDPHAEARIAANDRHRLVRAWSVFQSTGRPLSDWFRATKPPLAADRWLGVILAPGPETIVERCNRRLDRMVQAGAAGEVAALLARRLGPGAPAMKALGVAAFAQHLSGGASLAETIQGLAAETRRYAKRQSTWFRHQQPDWPRIVADDAGQQRAALLGLVRPEPRSWRADLLGDGIERGPPIS